MDLLLLLCVCIHVEFVATSGGEYIILSCTLVLCHSFVPKGYILACIVDVFTFCTLVRLRGVDLIDTCCILMVFM